MFTKNNILIWGALLFLTSNCVAWPTITGAYFQWGYNKEWYTHSNITFKMSNGNDFTIYDAKAHDKPDFHAILTRPQHFSIPQYNMRLGFYMNEKRTKGFEINFDHTKYVVTDYQKVHIKGNIDKQYVNTDTILEKDHLLHFEHTDGANFLHFNYFQINSLIKNNKKGRDLFASIWKAGLGINIPRTDFTWHGDELNNRFHVAGYNASIEGGLRWIFSKHFFLEGTGKTGYVRYINALADTKTTKGNRAHHGFGYFECIWTIGYQIQFNNN